MRFALALVIALLATSRAEAGRGTALIKYLPDDTNFVVACDVARSRGSAIFKQGFKIAREQNTALDALAATHPVEKLIDTILIGATPSKHAVTVMEGRVDKLFAEAKKNASKSDMHQGVTYWTTVDGEVALVDKRLVFTTAGDMTGVIDRAKDKKAKGPGTARALLSTAVAGSGVFGGLVFDSTQRSDLNKQFGAEPQSATFSFTLTKKLAVDARMKFANDTAAAAATKALNDHLTPETRGRLEGFVGKEFSDSISIEQQQAFARVRATMTTDEVDKVAALAKMFM